MILCCLTFDNVLLFSLHFATYDNFWTLGMSTDLGHFQNELFTFRNELQHRLFAPSHSMSMSLLPLQFNDDSQTFGMSFNLSESFHFHCKRPFGLFCTLQTMTFPGLWNVIQSGWIFSTFRMSFNLVSLRLRTQLAFVWLHRWLLTIIWSLLQLSKLYSFALKQIRSLCIQASSVSLHSSNFEDVLEDHCLNTCKNKQSLKNPLSSGIIWS